MSNETPKIISTSEQELIDIIKNLSTDENTKLVIVDSQNKLSSALIDNYKNFEFENILKSKETKSDFLNAFIDARCSLKNISTQPIIKDSVIIGLRLLENKFIQENLSNEKCLYFSNSLNDYNNVADLAFQTLLIVNSEEIKNYGKKIRNEGKKIVILFVNTNQIIQELIHTIVSEARPANLNLIFASTDSNSFDYINNSELKNYVIITTN